MASSYSTDLKLELMVTGENAGTWGDKTNSNLNLVQQAIAGVEGITLTDSDTTTLTMSDAALSNARNMVLKINTITLTGATILALPDGIEKFYILDATQITAPTNLTFKTTSGTGFALTDAKIYAAYSDGTNISEISLNTLGGTIATAQIDDNAITSAKISANQVTTAKIADNAITSAKISDNQVTTAKIADDAVGPDQLSNTTVTAGSYTATSLTVDAQGRITAASSGSGGAGGFVPAVITGGPSSGTYSSNAGASQILIYGVSGSGGGGSGNPPRNATGGTGASGAFAAYSKTITHPFSQPYAVGGGGGGGNWPGLNFQSGNPGGNGGATSLANVFNINGGNGGAGSHTGIGASGTVGTVSNSPEPAISSTTDRDSLVVFSNLLGNQPSAAGSNGSPGKKGGLAIFENIGTG